MSNKGYKVIGVMSGTSLDGIDLVYVEFTYEKEWNFNIINSKTVAYDDSWITRLRGLVNMNFDKLKLLDAEYTSYLANIIQSFIKKNRIRELDAICSHGHTALHKPDESFTYQIGNLSIIAEILSKTVVCDFRIQDVKLGGQGAPLVPIGDKLLFSESDYCLNLGGFANISSDINDDRIAYDICPVNIVLNHYSNQLNLAYDDHGRLALSGKTNKKLLNKLNDINFYKLGYPKSLGLEWVKSEVFPLIDSFQLEIKDILHTFCEHIAVQISKEINKTDNSSVLVSGGGVYNSYLMSRLKFYSKNKIIIPDTKVVEFKEALIFAFLGVLKLEGEINCLKSVTGASKDHSTGVIYQP